MEKEIEMQMKNSQGKTIIKKVPESLSSFYKTAGWDFVDKKVEKKETILTNSDKKRD